MRKPDERYFVFDAAAAAFAARSFARCAVRRLFAIAARAFSPLIFDM